MAIILANGDGTFNVHKNNRKIIGQIKESRGLLRFYVSRHSNQININLRDMEEITDFMSSLATPKDQIHG